MKTIRVYPTNKYDKLAFGNTLNFHINHDAYEDSITEADHDTYLFLAIDKKYCWLEVIAINKSTGISSGGGFRCDINELNSFLSEA